MLSRIYTVGVKKTFPCYSVPFVPFPIENGSYPFRSVRSVPFVPFHSVPLRFGARAYVRTVPGRMNVRGCIAVYKYTVTCTQISSTEFLCSGNQNCSVSCDIALTSCALRTHCRV